MDRLLVVSQCSVDKLERGRILLWARDSVFWGLRSMTPFKVLRVFKKTGRVASIELQNLETGRQFEAAREDMPSYFGTAR